MESLGASCKDGFSGLAEVALKSRKLEENRSV